MMYFNISDCGIFKKLAEPLTDYPNDEILPKGYCEITMRIVNNDDCHMCYWNKLCHGKLKKE